MQHALPGSDPDCAYRVGHGVRQIKLGGPFLFGGWWVKVGYIATADSSITVSAGGLTQQASVSQRTAHALLQGRGPNVSTRSGSAA